MPAQDQNRAALRHSRRTNHDKPRKWRESVRRTRHAGNSRYFPMLTRWTQSTAKPGRENSRRLLPEGLVLRVRRKS